MNKKWLKRGLILGAFAMIAFVFLEFFFWDCLAVWRFLKEEKIATKTYFENKNTFDEIRFLSNELPSYNLDLNKEKENSLTLNLKESDSEERFDTSYLYYNQSQFSQGSIDTLINKEKWLIKIENAPNDTIFQEGLIFFKNNFTKFEKIRNGIKQINSTHISNVKNRSLHIEIKENFYEKLQYSHYQLYNSKNIVEDESYFGENIDEYFSFHLYDKPSGLFCGYIKPTWMIPQCRFK
ncbi:MAG: hypothetical protein AB8H03_12525 [Saprospiraceae bacterium]